MSKVLKCFFIVWFVISFSLVSFSDQTTYAQSVPQSFSSALAVINLSNKDNLRIAFQDISPGTVIVLAPGRYKRGLFLKNIHGTTDAPIIITGSDPDNPPVFKGLGEGLKVRSSSYLKFTNIVFRGFPNNGINIDDSGNLNTPSHHIILENISVLDIGPKGNHDAIKFSGVNHFIIRNCRIEGWGGSGIDLVGCHNGVIENSAFIHKEGFRTGNSIQIKGGSRFILVQNNYFENSGSRIVQIGGSTGLQYFRPEKITYEAKDVQVAGNTFVGGEAQIAWVTAQNSKVHNNLFYLPQKWLGRILQETKKHRFKPSQKGLFEKNLVVTDERVKVYFNVGKGTAPKTFVFRENLWFRIDGDNKPDLPTLEKDGIYNIDPMILKNNGGTLQINSAATELQHVGPSGYTPWQQDQEFTDIKVPPITVPEQEISIWDRMKALVD